MSTDIESRLRDALAARADLVRPEDLQPLAPVVELRPRWQSPWVLLATAAAVLLVLGIVVQGVGGDQRSDRIAPQPDRTDRADVQLEIPADIGRGWTSDEYMTPERLDLDGDGIKEKVVFLGEQTKNFDGRTRIQTTLSSTGEEAYGIAELGTTIATSALPPIDADGDGDQELVLLHDESYSGPVQGGFPLVFDLRDGLLVQAVPDEPELLIRGEFVEEGSATEYYDMVRVGDFWIEDGRLHSSRTVRTYSRGQMMRRTPSRYVVDAWTWTLDEDGALRHGDAECLMQSAESRLPCGKNPTDTPMSLPPERASSIRAGETLDAIEEGGYGFTARVEGDATLVVDGYGRHIERPLDVPEPMLGGVPATGIFFDGASLVVTSASDPSLVQVFTQNDDRMVLMEPVGEIDLTNSEDQRTWLTENGVVLSAIADGNGGWVLWQWVMVSRNEIAALPWGTVCIDDVDDPTSMIAC